MKSKARGCQLEIARSSFFRIERARSFEGGIVLWKPSKWVPLLVVQSPSENLTQPGSQESIYARSDTLTCSLILLLPFK